MPGKYQKKEMEKTLDAIYHDDDGKKVDMRIRRLARPGKKKILIGLIVFFGMIFTVSWMGILIFSRFGGGASGNVKVGISGPAKVVAGEEMEYEVKFKNSEEYPLASSEIGLYLPKSFILQSSEPLLSDKNMLKIGSIKPGEEKSIKFKGKFFASEGSREVLQAALNYKPSNFNSSFEKVGTLEVEIAGSIFDGSLDGPDKLVAGDSATYKLTYKNKSEEDLENIAIDAVLPSEFVIATTTPAIGRNNRWDIGKLEKGAEGEVELSGSFGSGADGARDIILKLGIIDEDGAFLTLIEKKVSTEVVGGGLITSVTAGGAAATGHARWGEPVNFSITYKNEGKETLYNVKLRLDIISVPKEQGKDTVNWSSFKDLNGGRLDGDSVVWTKNEVAALAKVKPGDEKTIDFNVNIIPRPAAPSYRDYKIDGVLTADIERAGNVAVKRKLPGGKISVFIDSDAGFTSQARYYDANNNVVGSGPLPPKVGEKTTVRVFWKITNTMHDLENIEVSAVLPDSVVFSNSSADAGVAAMDSSGKKIAWMLNLMPASVGAVSAQFDLSVTPKAEDAGKVLNLLEQVVFTARDKSTGGTITINGGDETTALSDDQYVTAGGKVSQ